MKPGKCVDRIERLRAVEREYLVAIAATTALAEAVENNSALLSGQGLHYADFKSLSANLQATYMVRLFAEFETGIRDFWRQGLNRRAPSRTYDVIQSVASRRRIPFPPGAGQAVKP